MLTRVGPELSKSGRFRPPGSVIVRRPSSPRIGRSSVGRHSSVVGRWSVAGRSVGRRSDMSRVVVRQSSACRQPSVVVGRRWSIVHRLSLSVIVGGSSAAGLRTSSPPPLAGIERTCGNLVGSELRPPFGFRDCWPFWSWLKEMRRTTPTPSRMVPKWLCRSILSLSLSHGGHNRSQDPGCSLPDTIEPLARRGGGRKQKPQRIVPTQGWMAHTPSRRAAHMAKSSNGPLLTPRQPTPPPDPPAPLARRCRRARVAAARATGRPRQALGRRLPPLAGVAPPEALAVLAAGVSTLRPPYQHMFPPKTTHNDDVHTHPLTTTLTVPRPPPDHPLTNA